jgi:predicted ABC-type transport system involved in lysophospholipase L1 biosynthesis ATPase subunit
VSRHIVHIGSAGSINLCGASLIRIHARIRQEIASRASRLILQSYTIVPNIEVETQRTNLIVYGCTLK